MPEIITAADIGTIDASIATAQDVGERPPTALEVELEKMRLWRLVKHQREDAVRAAIPHMPTFSILPGGISIHGNLSVADLETLLGVLKAK